MSDEAADANAEPWWPEGLAEWISEQDSDLFRALDKGLRSFGWPDYNVPLPLPLEDSWPGLALALAAALAAATAALREAEVPLGRIGSSEPLSAQEYRQLGIEAHRIVRAASRVPQPDPGLTRPAGGIGLLSTRRVPQLAKPTEERIEWKDVRAGDEITLTVFDRQLGLQRERRTVVGVHWPFVRLRDGEREYEIDAEKPERLNRGLARVPQPDPKEHGDYSRNVAASGDDTVSV